MKCGKLRWVASIWCCGNSPRTGLNRETLLVRAAGAKTDSLLPFAYNTSIQPDGDERFTLTDGLMHMLVGSAK